MSFFIDFNSLNSSDLNTLIETNNIIPDLIVSGSKESNTTTTSNATYTEATLLIDTGTGTPISIPTSTGTTETTSTGTTGTGTTGTTGTTSTVVIENSNIQLIDSFTNAEIVQFYKDVLNAIDNMILLDYIRDYVMPQKVDTVNYFVTKTLDVNLDLALAYYAIKYPNDTSVDTIKLQELSVIIEAFYAQ
jgi:hypothetical protein